MKLSDSGLNAIKRDEGFRPFAYDDANPNHPVQPGDPIKGTLTIGYGHTEDVQPGDTISELAAEALLREDVADAEKLVKALVTAKLNQNEYDALVSWAFNLGSQIEGSTAIARLNSGQFTRQDVAEAMKWWNKVTINGVKKVSDGLVTRRAREAELFLTPVKGTEMNATKVKGQIRHLLTGGGGLLIGLGLASPEAVETIQSISDEQIMAVVGIISAIVGQIMSWRAPEKS